MKIFLILSCSLLALSSSNIALATISPRDKFKESKELKVLKGPQKQSVFDKKLLKKTPLAKDILVHARGYHEKTNVKRVNYTTLGFVTPWNSHGYDVAKTFGRKFNIISPIWFQVVKKGNGYEMKGEHDIDKEWLRDIRRASNQLVKIYPRVIFDRFTQRDMLEVLLADRSKIYEMIKELCRENNFDGIVLEFWTLVAGHFQKDLLIRFVQELSEALRMQMRNLSLVIPAAMRPKMPDLFTAADINMLHSYVHAFILVTYDFSDLQRPGANAPVYWIRENIEKLVPNDASPDVEIKRKKILMGLNMYGYDFTPDGGGALVGEQYLDLLKHVKKHLTYDERDVESFFEVSTSTGRHIVFYPTLYSINERVMLADKMGVGVALWELGQGLDYFYDLF